jgi:hypothetical protein
MLIFEGHNIHNSVYLLGLYNFKNWIPFSIFGVKHATCEISEAKVFI